MKTVRVKIDITHPKNLPKADDADAMKDAAMAALA
jgi:hypothetical protein